MNFKPVLFLLSAFLLCAFGLPKNIQKKVDKEVKSIFNVETFTLNVVTIPAEITSTLPSTFTADNFFKIETDSSFLGYAYVAKAASKTDEFDYLVLLDKDLIVLKAKVLVYREDYGSEIGSKRWLKQFTGKTDQDTLAYSNNIAAISGATISAKSMTVAMNNLLQSIKILHSKNMF